jgi:predicted RNase H-like nuclease (RuvC/YqgF family)
MDDSTRPSLPEPDSVSPVPESVAEEDAEGEASFEHLPAEHRDVMQRLYRRVEQAAATIERLRAENERLRRRVEELEAQPSFPDEETVLTLDEDPEDVKQRITRFIDAIDTYLDVSVDEDSSGDGAADANEAPSDS